VILQEHRALELLDHARRERIHGAHRSVDFADYRELVAAQARDEASLQLAATEAFGNALQELVADVMAQRIVDRLEIVQVQGQQHDARLDRAGAPQFFFQVSEQLPAIR
jgi:hypothetical protein